eukprot:CAMPEP_0174381156 /NCGR_PEP_ID=MMETSP0811_2-20130205/123830_1 /TAXON_ID=73025 ORGANISM="Eutreptiella gymnastica-like, Strain CCMP1594" /NCGR_SAMPLE_ID=MMETSP0811_2 /ASSEMBLY_ACC=CAM_ASM_000667 /LENGTH=410 /DNA_ID=CAMNT_0015534215 /DNA_START=32 /DNA_END=1264 /DNA_ORIENTATION=-
MTTATCLAVKLRPELEQKWRDEATRRYEEQFWTRWERDASGRALRNATRQEMNESSGTPEVQSLLQGDYFAKDTGFPPKRRPFERDLVKENKANCWNKRGASAKSRKHQASKRSVGRCAANRVETAQETSALSQAWDSEYGRLQLQNRRRKPQLFWDDPVDPNTVGNSLTHSQLDAHPRRSSAGRIRPNTSSCPAAARPATCPLDAAAGGAALHSGRSVESAVPPAADEAAGRSGASGRERRSLAAAIKEARKHKKQMEAAAARPHGSICKRNSKPAAADKITVEDIELFDADNNLMGPSEELHNGAASGAAVRHVKQSKGAQPHPRTKCQSGAQSQKEQHRGMPPHKSVGPADGSRETGVYNTMTNYHREGPIRIASHSERVTSDIKQPLPASADQRSPIYFVPAQGVA